MQGISSGSEDEGNDPKIPEKEIQYLEFKQYITRALFIDDIMTAADVIVKNGLPEKNGDQNKETDGASDSENNDTKDQDASTSDSVREYFNYAQGIKSSNFQISYDALFRGWLNLNPDPKTINALYRSSIVALFIFVICALVDGVSFFAGLLLFKNIFLFDMNDAMRKIGYLNYDAALVDFFTLPENGRDRHLRLALIYQILYGEVNTPNNFIMNSPEFKQFCDNSFRALKELGIDIGTDDLPKLQLWLTSFVHTNEIDFDDLFCDEYEDGRETELCSSEDAVL